MVSQEMENMTDRNPNAHWLLGRWIRKVNQRALKQKQFFRIMGNGAALLCDIDPFFMAVNA